MVLNHIYSRRAEAGGIEYFWPHDVENQFDAEGKIVGARLKSDGSAVDYEGVGTMSKSRNNGVDPQELIDKYGADTARLFTMFASPPEQTLEWNDAGVEGASRVLRRLWALAVRRREEILGAAQPADIAAARTLRRDMHLLLRQVSYDYERMQYNTVVSGAMKMLNALEAAPAGSGHALREGVSILLRALYPACPHLTWVLWRELGFVPQLGDLLDAPWPRVDEAALVQDEIELVLQVNGKTRGNVRVAAQADRDAIEAAATASPDFAKFAEGRTPKKIIVVPGRLVNVVV
jgi:leucyl-tRNA synthetase